MVLRNGRAPGRVDFFELHGNPLARAARNDPLFGKVLPEKEVEEQPGTGRQYQDENPRQRLERIPVIGNDDQNDAEDRHRVDDQKYRGQNLLHRNQWVSFSA